MIDCGALVTGLSNREVAEYLITTGLKHVDGVLFYDEEDVACICSRSDGGGTKVTDALTANLKPGSRFTFYDHAHCTGLDVKQRVDCVAALTVSKDTTLRDAAQAAFRLRRLGAGKDADCSHPRDRESRVVATRPLSDVRKDIDAGCSRKDWCESCRGWPIKSGRRTLELFVLAEHVQNVARKVAHATLAEQLCSLPMWAWRGTKNQG